MLGHLEQLLGGIAQVASAAGVDQAEGLAGFGIQQEESLSLFGSRLAGAGTPLDHVAFGVAEQPVRIQGQHLAGEVATGPAQLAQTDLELLGLLDGVGFQQVMQGSIGGQPRQAVGQLKASVPQRTIGAEGRPAQRRFVDQMQRQARSQSFIGQFTRPGSQQIPGAQAQVLRQE